MKGSLSYHLNGEDFIFTDKETGQTYVMPRSEVFYRKDAGKGNLARIMEECEAELIPNSPGCVSHAMVQRRLIDSYKTRVGEVITCRVIFVTEYSAFLALGNHVMGKLPLNHACNAQLPNLRMLLRTGQEVKVIVKAVTRDGVLFTMKELLGTFMQNTRSLKPHTLMSNCPITGLSTKCIYVLLKPNLVGAIPFPADPDMFVGQYLDVIVCDECDTDYSTVVCQFGKVSTDQFDSDSNLWPQIPIEYFPMEGKDFRDWRYMDAEV